MKISEVLETVQKRRLVEGGNVFPDVSPIKKEYVPGMIKDIKTMLPSEIKFVDNIGSAGFKVESGDMDIFVDFTSLAAYFKVGTEKEARAYLKKYLDAKGIQTALSGRNVHIALPVPDGNKVQVDLMVIPNAEKVAPWHQHGLSGQYDNPKFKGKYLQILYSSLAKALGLKFSSFEGTLRNRANDEVVADTKEEIAKVLLNPKATTADLNNPKAVYNALQNDPLKDAKLKQAYDDMAKGVLPEDLFD